MYSAVLLAATGSLRNDGGDAPARTIRPGLLLEWEHHRMEIAE
jgi:hypothetical protein